MNRKKTIYTVAIIEAILNIVIILLFVLGKMSLTEFIISFGAVTLLTTGVLFVILRKKTDEEAD